MSSLFNFFSGSNKKKTIWTRLSACLLLLIALIFFGQKFCSQALAEFHWEEKRFPIQTQRISQVEDGKIKIITEPTIDEKVTVYNITPNTKIELNEEPVSLDALKAGDEIKVEEDKNNLPLFIRASRPKAGFVIDANAQTLLITSDYLDKKEYKFRPNSLVTINKELAQITQLHKGDPVTVRVNTGGQIISLDVERASLFQEFFENFRKNLFKPLLMFFYMGFCISLLSVAFEFPHVIYQGLTIYLLISIGWHGGEELANLSGQTLGQAMLFMMVGFLTNLVIGIIAFFTLRLFVPKMRKIDAATVAGYYGSDSAGTFVTCLGVLQSAHIAYAAFMPVMLAIMEIPGCLIALFLVSRLRKKGMDAAGNMPGEENYDPNALPPSLIDTKTGEETAYSKGVHEEEVISLETDKRLHNKNVTQLQPSTKATELMREVFLNPGLFLLFGGIVIGFISRLQGYTVTEADDRLFVNLFQGMLCLFLLEMGMTAAKRLQDLKAGSWKFIAFGLIAPNIFAITGIIVAQLFCHVLGVPFQLGTLVLFAVLCAAASYIAVPAIQRLAIPEASPTLPLAASLGLTFTYNVTIGIPLYILIAEQVMRIYPVPL